MSARARLGLTACLATLVGLVIYLQGTAPSVVEADTGELQTIAAIGGLPHPTGYPVFVLFGRLFTLLPFGEPAYRVNVMSGVFGAVALGLMVVLLRTIGLSLRGAFAGALLYGFTYTLWDSALRAGTYTIAVCIAILGLWRTIVAFRSGRPRDLALAAFLLGLMVTGHMSFLLPVATLGLALAGRALVARQRVVASLVLLAGAFVLGLTPFLYVLWADGRSYPMNYLRLVDTVFDPAGLHNPYLTTPIKRLAWMVFGRNELPTPPLHPDAVVAAKRLWRAALTLFLFEFGPLASPFIVVGLVRRARHELGIAVVLAAALVASLAVPALVNTGFMMGVFLIPCTLLCSIFAADGLAVALDAAGRRRPGAFRAAALAVVAPVLLVLPAHLIRIYTYDHPLGPRHDIQVPEHDERQVRSVIPTMRDYWGPRRFGEQAMAAIPPDALVAAQWGPMTVLDYFRWVEGRRPDLTILTSDPRIVRHWRETHDLAKRPIVFVNRTPDAAPYLAHADSLEVAWGQWLYVVRSAPGAGAE